MVAFTSRIKLEEYRRNGREDEEIPLIERTSRSRRLHLDGRSEGNLCLENLQAERRNRGGEGRGSSTSKEEKAEKEEEEEVGAAEAAAEAETTTRAVQGLLRWR